MNESAKIKLVAFDLDNTALFQGALTDGAADALKRAHQTGYILVISTGRQIKMISPSVILNSCADYIISSNGARVSGADGETFFYRPMSLDTALALLRALKPAKSEICAHLEHEAVFELKNTLHFILQGDKSRQGDVSAFFEFMRMTKQVISAERVLRRNRYGAVEKLLSFCVEPDDSVRALEIASGFSVEAVAVTRHEVEITAAGVSKGSALRLLCERLGISRDEVAAIGDSGNDLSLREGSGVFIAMGNAEESVKALADFITDDVENDGFRRAFERLRII